ncbi:P-loop containing nucleoside triphosphate hydrolase protein [Ochromonadaceae sp. CCMP2298]|nr:P-loop containing nucleoside triphosphate hydrolase protein [Ochromonadaceae sp. CCMP2298]
MAGFINGMDKGHLEVVWMLLEKGAEIQTKTKLVARCFRYRYWGQDQGKTQIEGQRQGQRQGLKEGGEGEVVELGEDENLLDPVGNAPLKTYTLDLQAQAQAHRNSSSNSSSSSSSGIGKKLPLRLSKREREVNLAVGMVLLLGRSGTGKTICLCNRMASNRQSNPLSSQQFVCRSRRLRDSVQRYQRDYGNLDGDSGGGDMSESGGGGDRGDSGGGGSVGVQSPSPGAAAFLTLEAFLDAMENKVLGDADTGTEKTADTAIDTGTVTGAAGSGSGQKYLPSKRPKLDLLVAWTQIRSFIKGSLEALLKEGEGAADSSTNTSSSGTSSNGSRALFLPDYLALAKGRCRLQPPERAQAYAVYVQYEALLLRAGLWKGCDRVMRILLDAGLNLPLGKRSGGGGWGEGGGFGQVFDKVYVDEVQDSSQIEIALNFLAAGMRYDRLFLTGDPAHSIVEGIDFRFDEVRGIVHALSQQTVKIPRPVTLNTNYRCHAGILNCASGVLNLLLSTFPHAADKLPRDKLWGAQAGDGESLSSSELSQLVPEETLALGIQASKGMEFPDMETQLKLLYTAVTRSCTRLIIAETHSSAADDAFFRWLEELQLAERMEKREQGQGGAEGQGQGEGKEGEGQGRAGDKAQNLRERVLLQEQVERAREGFTNALGDAATLTPAHEVELAALVLWCVELQLYQNALDLGSLLLPHLPAQSQELMRERVLGELRVFTAG